MRVSWLVSLAVLATKLCCADRDSFDCKMRQLAVDYARYIQPDLRPDQLAKVAKSLMEAADATPNCTLILEENRNEIDRKHMMKPVIKSDFDGHFCADVHVYGNKKGRSMNSDDFRTLEDALEYLRQRCDVSDHKRVTVHGGLHRPMKGPIQLGLRDSNMIIRAAPKERVIFTGAVRLTQCRWTEFDSSKKIYVTDLSNEASSFGNRIPGLRINGSRAIRARYPNANPEEGFGSDLLAYGWLDPVVPSQPEYQIKPEYPERPGYTFDQFTRYQLGVGGVCDSFFPSAGYWCGNETQGGGAQTWTVPAGLLYNRTLLPNSPYQNLSGAVLHAWQQHHWATWVFEINDQSSSDEKLVFDRGGFQDARGAAEGKEFYIENVFEELDSHSEWFYNDSDHRLYLVWDNDDDQTTTPPPDCSENSTSYDITHDAVLMNVNGWQNSTISGFELRDTRITYFEPHGQVSGGDWALQRIAVINVTDAMDVSIHDNVFIDNDGVSVMISGRNRKVKIIGNEFVRNGESCVALWGYSSDSTDMRIPETMGWDATAMDVPMYTMIHSNFAYGFGIWQKQSSFAFIGKSTRNLIAQNIAFDMPRASVNMNDGLGGGNNVTSNLMFNSCLESGDHGVLNSWDRQLYQFVNSSGMITTIPEFNHIMHNYFIGDNEQVQCVVDNDDGSAFYKVEQNVLVYGPIGQKSDSGGHSNIAVGNLYAYVETHGGWDWWGPSCFHIFEPYQLDGFENVYSNNTCVINADRMTYGAWNCSDHIGRWPQLGDNRIYTLNGSTGLCGLELSAFQSIYDYDLGTAVDVLPSDASLIQQAENLLFV